MSFRWAIAERHLTDASANGSGVSSTLFIVVSVGCKPATCMSNYGIWLSIYVQSSCSVVWNPYLYLAGAFWVSILSVFKLECIWHHLAWFSFFFFSFQDITIHSILFWFCRSRVSAISLLICLNIIKKINIDQPVAGLWRLLNNVCRIMGIIRIKSYI